MGWTSHALPYLQNVPDAVNRSNAYYTDTGSFPAVLEHISARNGTAMEGVTGIQASWIASLAPLGALVGALSAGYVARAIGRKKLLLLLAVLYLLGWSLIVGAGSSVSDLGNGSFRQTALLYCTTIGCFKKQDACTGFRNFCFFFLQVHFICTFSKLCRNVYSGMQKSAQ
jgi:MFS family permease